MPAAHVLEPKILRAGTAEQYDLYRAAIEYDLADPIVIEAPDDVKSAPRWRERVEPFHHQVGNLMSFCRRLPVTLLADDVGLGKTISAGLVMSELIARGRLSKALVVCPKLLGPQWKEELETKFDIKADVVTGQELLAADPEAADAVITTYQTARTYLEKLPVDRFDMLVLDEAHKLRNLHGTPNPPQVAKCFHKALRDRRFRYVLMLTATPIQNRLWDLYSLVELLTVARGHDNPFGSPEQFARKFIAGDRDQARALKPEAAEQFRSIVYGYMSRVRRGDAKLHFPARKVQLHRVQPTPAELRLIDTVGKGIRPLNRLSQISILQALSSSPDALSAQLDNMARKDPAHRALADEVKLIVRAMTSSAKLTGLDALIEHLKRENPDRWRLVIFTGRRETQTTIQRFLDERGLKSGLINGSSGPRNQETLAAFRAEPPAHRIIVSTEAGSEGVNLQAANVLVNYDLPWNPMIVEQRIGRVQRLGSKFASVGVFNMTLKGTFEEQVVGRLMEKLQMSTSAIGDIESLLEGAAGTEDGPEEAFQEKIRQLVVAALQGVDVDMSVRQQTESIEAARKTLADEEKRIDELLGGMDGVGYIGPKAPSLPRPSHAMPPEDFGRAALHALGRDDDVTSSTIVPGSPAFARLVQGVIASGVHAVRDADTNLRSESESIAARWCQTFGAVPVSNEIIDARRTFNGKLLVRIRAVVAHDSYERLIEIDAQTLGSAQNAFSRDALGPLPSVLPTPAETLGLDAATTTDAATHDPAIAEFNRFYLERRAQEMASAGGDERKRKKMEDEFTPRLSFALVGADGILARDVRLRTTFRLDGEGPHDDELILRPSTGEILSAPAVATCAVSQRLLPVSCLGTCAISGQRAARHALRVSPLSGRTALPEHLVTCEATGQQLVKDEVERSDISGRLMSRAWLKRSALSGKRAEAEHFGRCAFSSDEVLLSELRTSEISGKPYRADATASSALSRRAGHRDEFVTSSVSGIVMLPDEAVHSAHGKHCAPVETRRCLWSGRKVHPDDLRMCALTGIDIHFEYMTAQAPPRLEPLARMLDGIDHRTDRPELWDAAARQEGELLGRAKCRVGAATLAPDQEHIAIVSEVRTLLGLRSRRSGFVYSTTSGGIVGRIALGKRTAAGWTAT